MKINKYENIIKLINISNKDKNLKISFYINLHKIKIS